VTPFSALEGFSSQSVFSSFATFTQKLT
jgi:hypothetical protein